MSKHTPGPWAAHWDAEEPTLVVQAEKLGPSYWVPLWGKIFSESPPTQEDYANARLIAAAPEMYEALQRIVRCAPGDVDMALERCHAAIAKAEGGE